MAKNLYEVIGKLNSIFKKHNVEHFLITESAKKIDPDEVESFALGVKWEEVEGKMDDIFDDLADEFDNIKTIKAPYSYDRAFKFIDGGITYVIAAYFLMGDNRFCPFRKSGKSLTFPDAMLDKMKKLRVGNKYLKVPTPVEDYLKVTFDEKTGKYKAKEFVNAYGHKAQLREK